MTHITEHKRIHLIGIGGCSMSGLASILKNRGYYVQGSDRAESPFTERLKELGVPVFIGHDAKNIGDCDLIIFSAAIKSDNVERAEAKRRIRYWAERLEVTEYLYPNAAKPEAALMGRRRSMLGGGAKREMPKRPDQLSKGNQQKIQLMAALLSDPELLILDEPLSGLDPINADLFKGIIREEIAAGKYLIMSSHQMATVEEFCTDLTILDRSKTVLQGHLNDIKRSYGRVHLQLKTESDPAPYIAECGAQIVTQKEFEYHLKVTGAQQANGLLARLTQAGVPVVLFNLREPSLHEIFVETVGGESDA